MLIENLKVQFVFGCPTDDIVAKQLTKDIFQTFIQ